MHLYVSNLSVNVLENDLEEIFGQFGTVTQIEILKDPLTSNPLGTAVVTMPKQGQANEAIDNLNLNRINERRVLVSPTVATGNRRKKSRLKTDTDNFLKIQSQN